MPRRHRSRSPAFWRGGCCVVTSREALAKLPVTRKLRGCWSASRRARHQCVWRLQRAGLWAGHDACVRQPRHHLRARGHAAQTTTAHGAGHLRAAGFRRGELIHNSFSYHFVPAGSMMETGAHALGCTVFPGGTGQTEQRKRTPWLS